MDVPGWQVVLDDAPPLGPVGVDDGVVVFVEQVGPALGFAARQVGAFLALITDAGTRRLTAPLILRLPPVTLRSLCSTATGRWPRKSFNCCSDLRTIRGVSLQGPCWASTASHARATKNAL